MPNDKGCRWATRDIIFTDRALYIFQEIPQSESKDRHINYLEDEYGKSNVICFWILKQSILIFVERMDMNSFTAKNLHGEMSPPAYRNDIPPLPASYTIIIELSNNSNRKLKLIACNGPAAA